MSRKAAVGKAKDCNLLPESPSHEGAVEIIRARWKRIALNAFTFCLCLANVVYWTVKDYVLPVVVFAPIMFFALALFLLDALDWSDSQQQRRERIE